MKKEELFELLEKSQYLPKITNHISEILELLSNPVNLNVDELVKKVSSNETLNDLMISNLNSGYFQLSRKVSSIKEAIVYLGMHTVQNLLIFFITRQLFPDCSIKRDRTFDMVRYWKHVLGTSVASSMLSLRLKQGDKFKLFSYGLIHDIGIAVLDVCLPELIDEVSEILKRGVHQLVAERSVLGGITHADIGAWLCRRWNIREDIVNIIEYHHTPFLAKSNTFDVKLMHVADTISTEYYEKLLGLNLNHGISSQVIDSLGLTGKDIEAVSQALPNELEKLGHYFLIQT